MKERIATPPEVRLEPHPREWETSLRSSWAARSRDESALGARAAMGLPTDRPVVMTGHQPILFHAGVLAKYLAASSLASRTNAHAAFLVVDEDETDPGALRVPTRTGAGGIGERTLRLLPAPPPGAAAGWIPANTPSPPTDHTLADSPWTFVREGVAAAVAAMRAHADAPSLASQGALASFDLMRPLLRADATPVLASALLATPIGADILARLRDDASGFVRIHNNAVGAFPRARVAPLATDDARAVHELPLWRVGPGEARRRVRSDQLGDIPPASLAPRALLMTLLVRAGLCDLFIHGTGGWEYDRITEVLSREWLGVELAPMTLATATLRLPLLSEVPPTEREVAHAAWSAHRAAHDPAMLEDEPASRRKTDLLERIRAAPRKSHERAALYRSLHDLLAEARSTNAGALTRLRDDAGAIKRRHDAAGLANDRTWAFPLHERAALDSLARTIDAMFG